MLAELRALGLTLSLDGARLLVEPRALLTDALRNRIRAHKQALMRELAEEARPPQSRFPPWPKGRAAPYSNRRIRSLAKRARAGRSWLS